MAKPQSKSTGSIQTGDQTDGPINAVFHVKLYHSSSVPHTGFLRTVEEGKFETMSQSRMRKSKHTTMSANSTQILKSMSKQIVWKEEFEIDAIDIHISKSFTNLKEIELCTDELMVGSKSTTGFICTMKVQDVHLGIDRWIWPNSIYCICTNAYLPQNDPDKKGRAKDIQHARKMYQVEHVVCFPIKLKKLPFNEGFTPGYEHKRINEATQDYAVSKSSPPWNNLDDLNNVYSPLSFPQPKASHYWREDTWFGNQRLNRCNPKSIKLCEEIPSKLGVDEKMMKPVLKGETLKGLMKKNRLFYTDLEILEGIWHKKDCDFCVPIALFMLDCNNDLVPIAIQLQQQKGPDNPVFLPTDDWGVWTLAKMWYNLADASYHQTVVHLGLTHLLMQIVVVYMQRNISSRHPVYKILAPHKYYLMAINDMAFKKLIEPKGYVDETMTIGSKGMLKLFAEELERWDFFQDGIPANDFANRKVDDPNVLPKYYFRDDSIDLYNCIHKYVSEYMDLYYENEKDVEGDWELQGWIECLVRDGKLKGLPMKDGKGHVSSKKELKSIVAVIIFTCSVSHAAANFLQYEEYGFPANYPTMLRTPLLKDKKPKTDSDIIEALPDQDTVLTVLAVTYVLSSKETNSLGNFETQYICEDKGLDCVKRFQIALIGIDQKIRERNEAVERPYDILLPHNIPNAISI